MKKRYWTGNKVQLIEHRGKPHILWYDGDRPVLRVAKGATLAEQKSFAQKIEEEMTVGNFVRDNRTFAKMCDLFIQESKEQVEAALAHYRSPDVHTYTGGHFFASAYMEELPVKLSKFFRSVEV